jgi:hypothetical protein
MDPNPRPKNMRILWIRFRIRILNTAGNPSIPHLTGSVKTAWSGMRGRQASSKTPESGQRVLVQGCSTHLFSKKKTAFLYMQFHDKKKAQTAIF